MEPLLEINHINYAYHSMQGETPALQNIHFTVCKGDFIAVVGPSGCGKTTLLSLIAGLLLPEEGEILLNGKRLQEQSNNPIAAKRSSVGMADHLEKYPAWLRNSGKHQLCIHRLCQFTFKKLRSL